MARRSWRPPGWPGDEPADVPWHPRTGAQLTYDGLPLGMSTSTVSGGPRPLHAPGAHIRAHASACLPDQYGPFGLAKREIWKARGDLRYDSGGSPNGEAEPRA